MKALNLILATLLVSLAVSNFIPVPDFDITHLEGRWNIQSLYDTTGNDWTLAYCYEVTFQIINDSAVNLTAVFYYAGNDQIVQESYILYPDAENAAILYQDQDHKVSPVLVINTSSIPYWVGNTSATTILALNYTVTADDPQYVVMGLSKWYDTQYDIRPFLKDLNLPPVNYTQGSRNYWFINTACDTHYDWTPQRIFNATALLGEWNLVAVYEPFGHDLVQWYTQGPLFNWEEAVCAKVSFEKIILTDAQKMTLSLNSLLYETHFERTWQLGVTPGLNAVLMGFDIVGSTLLYVAYADLAGNMILTAGTTTSFLLSNKSNTLTTPLKAIFDAYIVSQGSRWNVDYVIPIAPC